MKERDSYSPQANTAPGAITRLARTVMGNLGGNPTLEAVLSTSTEVELCQDNIEIVTGEFVGDRLADRPRTARLPERFVERHTLGQMKIGKSAYTVPWAMAVTMDGFCYLNAHYTFKKDPYGTAQMEVSRSKEGYTVYVPHGYHYEPSRVIPWMGAAEEDLLPVHEVKAGRTYY